jgi:hypothetical protein
MNQGDTDPQKLHPEECKALRLFMEDSGWTKTGGPSASDEQYHRELSNGAIVKILPRRPGFVPHVQMDYREDEGSTWNTLKEAKEQAWTIFKAFSLLGIMERVLHPPAKMDFN